MEMIENGVGRFATNGAWLFSPSGSGPLVFQRDSEAQLCCHHHVVERDSSAVAQAQLR